MNPSDFCIKPWNSVLAKCEAEVVACNIMVILKRTGDTWRRLTVEEYEAERLKDGNYTYGEERLQAGGRLHRIGRGCCNL